MTQVEAFWVGQCPTPWGLHGALWMGKRSVAQWMPPHIQCHQACQRGLGAGWCLHGHPWVPPVFRAASVLSPMRISGGAGQQGLCHYSPVGSFTPQIFIECLLCARSCRGSKSQVRPDSCPPKARSWNRRDRSRETGAQALRGLRSHGLDLILHFTSPQEAPSFACPPHYHTDAVPQVIPLYCS